MKIKIYASKTWTYLKTKFTKDKYDQFMYIYDLISRVLKTLLSLSTLLLIIFYWNDLDIPKTAQKVIARIAEFKTVENQIAFKTDEVIPTGPIQPAITESSKNVYQGDNLVFTTDRTYDLETKDCFIDKMLVQSTPDYRGEFLYNKVKFKIINIQEYIGLLIGDGKTEGPVVRGIKCKII